MQVFYIGDILETAKCLDSKRYNKQIIEVKQIIKAIKGESNGWINHPCTIQYRRYVDWLHLYLVVFKKYKEGDIKGAERFSYIAKRYVQPNWFTQEYFDNMKKRLYTKDHNHYKQFEYLGESYENWYWVDNKWKIYKQKQ